MHVRARQTKLDDSPRPRVLGTGLVALDLVINRHTAEQARCYAGGTCGNVLTILSFLGWDSYPISRLNGEFTSQSVRKDLTRWDVHTDYLSLHPASPVPVIIERISAGKDGRPTHRYSFACPICGTRNPGYKAVLATAAAKLLPVIEIPEVFFFDRVSRAALLLAGHCREQGAVVVYEPSGVGEPNLFREALSLAHVLKYSVERLGDAIKNYDRDTVLLEIETQGDAGLRFRSRLPAFKTGGTWESLAPFSVPDLRDAAGAGDWLTAVLLDRLVRPGYASLIKTTKRKLVGALRFAQAAAAWNCGFESPRGGMYASQDIEVFIEQVNAILCGRTRAKIVRKPPRIPHDTLINGACLKCRAESEP